MRERGVRTLPFVLRSEDQDIPTIHQRVEPGSIVYPDESKAYDVLHARYATKRVNHSVEYWNVDACTNQAESFSSRLRRAEIRTHHHISGQYLQAYADQMAWREDNRRVDNGGLFIMVVSAAMSHPVLRQWKGYWQRSLQNVV